MRRKQLFFILLRPPFLLSHAIPPHNGSLLPSAKQDKCDSLAPVPPEDTSAASSSQIHTHTATAQSLRGNQTPFVKLGLFLFPSSGLKVCDSTIFFFYWGPLSETRQAPQGARSTLNKSLSLTAMSTVPQLKISI